MIPPVILRAPLGVLDSQIRQVLGTHTKIPRYSGEIQEFKGGRGKAGRDMAVLCWNVWRARKKRVFDLIENRIGATDLLVLQELPEEYLEKMKSICKGFDMVYAPTHMGGPAKWFPHKSCGTLVATRCKMKSSSVQVLPQVTAVPLGKIKVQRVAVYVQVSTTSGSLGIYGVHHETWAPPWVRRVQNAHLLKIIDNRKDKHIIVAGDFNSMPLKRMEMGGLRKRYNSLRPRSLIGLDEIFTSGKIVGKVILTKVSDHPLLTAHIFL